MSGGLAFTPELHVPKGKPAISLMDFSPLLLICAVPLGAKRCPRCQGNKGCEAGWGMMRGQARPSDWMEYNSLLLQQLKEGSTHPAEWGRGLCLALVWGRSDLLEPRHVARELALEHCRTDRCVKLKVCLESF